MLGSPQSNRGTLALNPRPCNYASNVVFDTSCGISIGVRNGGLIKKSPAIITATENPRESPKVPRVIRTAWVLPRWRRIYGFR